MKLSELDKNKYQFTDSVPSQGGGISSGIPGVTPLARMGATFGAEIGKAGFGLGETALRGVASVADKLLPKGKKMSSGGDVIRGYAEQAKKTSENIYGKPFEQEKKTFSGQLGQTVGASVPFFAGTAPITRGQGILQNILQPVSKIKGLGTATKAISQAIPETLVTGATQLGVSGGDIESAKEAGLLAGGTSGAFSTLGSLGRATFFPELKNSVTRALGIQGKTTGGMINQQIEKKIAGLSVLNKYAPDIKVKDAEGFEKTFKPSEATFDETLQAWNTARKSIYKKYHAISSNLGKSDFISKDGQIVSTGIDLEPVANELNTILNSPRTSPYKDSARSILSDLVNNFSTIKNGKPVFRKIAPDEIETFLSDLYVPASSALQGKGDKAYSEIAAGTAKGIRNLLDNAIEGAGGLEYTGLKSEYSALKSIEEDLVRRFQQEARQLGGGLSDYANIFNSGDIIAGIISQNPQFIAKGVGQGFLTSLLKRLKQPNRYLQRSFKLLDKSDAGDISSRVFGGVGGRALNEQDQKLADTIKNYIKNPKLGLSIEDVTKKTSSLSDDIPNVYKGEKDLTTKILKDLEGKTTVSKQYILDATNRPELKQAERDITRQVLDTMPDGQINVKEFADKVKSELLPLKVKGSDMVNPKFDQYSPRYMQDEGSFSTKYDSVALPDELRGKVANYKENIYESPIATSAGDVHFGYQTKNYFGHTRIEDMADNKTRRVIEVQSDLYQKGNLEKEGRQAREIISEQDGIKNRAKAFGRTGELDETGKFIRKEAEGRVKDVSKLEQYNDPTAHFRMVREEIKKAAQDGKTKLQFPTGETAMKIEGLGADNAQWAPVVNNDLVPRIINPSDLKVGAEISNDSLNSSWIITDVLGDGKFKAIPKDSFENIAEATEKYPSPDDAIEALQKGEFNLADLTTEIESFDISGKVDTNNPIYKFYEKDVAKYLNKFSGKRVIDDKGVSWIEIPITKEQAKMPVEAFGLAPFLINDEK